MVNGIRSICALAETGTPDNQGLCSFVSEKFPLTVEQAAAYIYIDQCGQYKEMSMETERYSHIIVGGGTAGCVLASRLSSSALNRVLLVEAGIDTPPSAMPQDIIDPYPLSYTNPMYRWSVRGHALTATSSPAAPLLQASVLGGGSSIMGMVMLRGTPADYDGWQAMGAKGWGWNDVLPYFSRLENDLDFGDRDLHGRLGPTPIRRHRVEGWPALATAALRYAGAHGAGFVDDLNADFRDGLGRIPIAGTMSQRASAATAYLTSDVRARPNLEILTRATAESLLVQGRTIKGVTVVHDGRRLSFQGTETILCMGALLTPHFMLRNGIGDATQLHKAGIPVVADVPGVGRNLQNHAVVTVLAHLKRNAVQRNPQRNHNDAMFRYTSGVPETNRSDMALMFGTRTNWHALAARIAHFSVVLMAPISRGRVAIGSTSAPEIEYNLLGDIRDRHRLVGGIERVAGLVASSEMSDLLGQIVGATKFAKSSRFNARTRRNALSSRALAWGMDYVPGFGARLLKSLAQESDSIAALATHPAIAAEFVQRAVMPLAHHCGTCAMGSYSDAATVVDVHGCVRDVEGLRVADASIIPCIPRANTNLPVLMIAEKISHHILHG